MLKTSHIGLVALAIAGALTAVSPVAAAKVSSDDVPSVTVDLRGFDLTTDQGLKLAQIEVRAAAHTVCPTTEGTRDLQEISAAKGCYNKAVTVADAQINDMRNLALRGNAGIQTAMVSALPMNPTR